MSNIVPSRRSGRLVPSRVERQAGREIEQFQAQGAVIETRQQAKVGVIGEVARSAIYEMGDVGAHAEMVTQRTPFVVAEVVGIAQTAGMALRRVVAETERLW
jgi:hypothetical protein